MGVINSAIFYIFELFPSRNDLIKRLFKENSNFQTLCDDFRRCSEALQYWDQSMRAEAPARSNEYRALQRELASEIDQFLNVADKQPSIRARKD